MKLALVRSSGRSVPMADRVARELERLFRRSRRQGDDDLVFCHRETGRALDASKVREQFRNALARGRVREITFPELCHRHAAGRRTEVPPSSTIPPIRPLGFER